METKNIWIKAINNTKKTLKNIGTLKSQTDKRVKIMKPTKRAEHCPTVTELQQIRKKEIFCEILHCNGDQIPGPCLPSEQEDFI